MKGIYWRTLAFKKSVIYLIKVNDTSYMDVPINTCVSVVFQTKREFKTVRKQIYCAQGYAVQLKV